MALSEAPFTRTCIWILSHQALFCSFHFFMASSSLVWRGKKPQNVEPLFLAQLKSKFTIIKARFTCKLVIRVEISAKSIECFHSRGQHLRQFIGTKESAYIRKEFNSHRTGLGHKHGRPFIVLGHKYGCHDVMWKLSIEAITLPSAAILSTHGKELALVIQTIDSTIHWINDYPVDKY